MSALLNNGSLVAAARLSRTASTVLFNRCGHFGSFQTHPTLMPTTICCAANHKAPDCSRSCCRIRRSSAATANANQNRESTAPPSSSSSSTRPPPVNSLYNNTPSAQHNQQPSSSTTTSSSIHHQRPAGAGSAGQPASAAGGARDPNKWLYKQLLGAVDARIRTAIDEHRPEVEDRVRELKRTVSGRVAEQTARHVEWQQRWRESPWGRRVAETLRNVLRPEDGEQQAGRREQQEYERRVRVLKQRGEKI